MRKAICVILACLLFCCAAAPVFADNRDLIVYIAANSTSSYRYHASASCSSLSHSTVASITLEEAADRGFTACMKCHPEEPDFPVSSTPRPRSGGVAYSTATPRPTVRPTPKPTAAPKPSDVAQTKALETKHNTDYILLVPPAAIIGYLLGRQHKKPDDKKKEP